MSVNNSKEMADLIELSQERADAAARWLVDWLEGGKDKPYWITAIALKAILDYSFYFDDKPLEGLDSHTREVFGHALKELLSEAATEGAMAGSWCGDAWVTSLVLMAALSEAVEVPSEPVDAALDWLCRNVSTFDDSQPGAAADYSPAFFAFTSMAMGKAIANGRKGRTPDENTLLDAIGTCLSRVVDEASYEGDWVDSAQATSQCLCALMEAGLDPYDSEWPLVGNGVRWLSRKQLPDGTWRRDLIETANCSLALAYAQKVERPQFSAAIRYLIGAQKLEDPDAKGQRRGHWFAEPRFTAWGLIGLSSWNVRRYRPAYLEAVLQKIASRLGEPWGPPRNDVVPQKTTISILRNTSLDQLEDNNSGGNYDVVVFEDERTDEKIIMGRQSRWDDAIIASKAVDARELLSRIADDGCDRDDVPESVSAKARRDLVMFGRSLAERVLPLEIRKLVKNLDEPSLVLIETDNRDLLSLPFEMMPGDRRGQFLGEKCAIGLRLVTSEAAMASSVERSNRPVGKKLHMLVLGNLGGETDIPWSSRECWNVARMLDRNFGYDVHLVVGVDEDGVSCPVGADELMDRVEDHDWDIVHYTGHIYSDDMGPYIPCADDRIRPEDFVSYVSGSDLVPPRLVFLNACNSGDVSFASFADLLRREHVRLVVGTRAPITDDTSARLAEVFYQELVKGVPVGHALLEARKRVRGRHGHDLTWLFFALFGDPTVTLQPGVV